MLWRVCLKSCDRIAAFRKYQVQAILLRRRIIICIYRNMKCMPVIVPRLEAGQLVVIYMISLEQKYNEKFPALYIWQPS